MLNSIGQAEKRLDFVNDKQLNNRKRQVKLKTCADVYEHWRTYKRSYKKAPSDGVEFQIDYIDTGLALDEDERLRAPIALALHGAPGSYHDFSLLINHLTKQRVRVIAPNFPEYVATVKTKVLFRHSADEKAAYLRDFLMAINVKKIDLLISHSSAIFPTLLILLNANDEALARRRRLSEQQHHHDHHNHHNQQQQRQQNETNDENLHAAKAGCDKSAPELTQNGAAAGGGDHQLDRVDSYKSNGRHTKQGAHANTRQKRAEFVVKFDEPIEIKAVALFNPAGHRLPKSMKPTWFKCGSVHVYQHKLGRSLFRKFGPAFLTVVGVPVRVDNMDNVMLSATVMRNSRCQRVVRQLQQLSQMKIPTLLVFSENDKLIEKEIFYEMTQFMKLDPKNFDVFNNEGDIELSRSLSSDWIRVMVFKAGGHYAYSNYAGTVNKAVSELLSKVTTPTPVAS
jgi:pimeloyl-ACP methyl ester carboxylesterase